MNEALVDQIEATAHQLANLAEAQEQVHYYGVEDEEVIGRARVFRGLVRRQKRLTKKLQEQRTEE